jgi:predicted nuclease of predicted toxin-antitoxin system
MKFLVDAQLPPKLAEWLRSMGHDAFAVREIGLRDADGAVIWRHVIADKAIIVIKGEDFAMPAAEFGSAKVLWVRVGNVSNPALITAFAAAWPQIEEFLQAGMTIVELR